VQQIMSQQLEILQNQQQQSTDIREVRRDADDRE